MKLPLIEDWFPTRERYTRKPLGRDKHCTACVLHADARNVCLAPTVDPGGPGTAMVVTLAPTKAEAEAGVSFTGQLSQALQRYARKHYEGTLVMTHLVRCPGKVLDHLDDCAPYLLGDVQTYKPDRVVLVGAAATASFGVYIDPSRSRRLWSRLLGVPAFAVMDPLNGAFNRFVRRQFEHDLRWALTTNVEQPKGEVEVLTDPEQLESYLQGLEFDKPVTVDVEHKGTLWDGDFELLCVGFCQDAERPVVATMPALNGAVDAVRVFLRDLRIPKVNQNIKHDRHALYRTFGSDMRGIIGDTMLQARLFEPEEQAGLGPLSWKVGMGGYKEAAKDLSEDGRGHKVEKLSPRELAVYNGRDTSATLRVYDWLTGRLGDTAQTWRTLIGPAFEALTKVERNGILLSDANVRSYDKWLEVQEQKLDTDLRSVPEVPVGFNPASNKQMGEFLYDILKIPFPKSALTKKGGRSVAKGTLEDLKHHHQVVQTLLDLSAIRKQRNTYGLGMLEHISPVDGRVHTTFKLVRTGRLSSSDPNMQNITKPEEPGDEGSWARGCFVPSPGHRFVQLDYSQMELRVAAMLSGDEAMASAFESGADFHTMTAAAAFGVKPEQVTSAQRKVAKTINFAIVYGKSEYGLSKDLGKPLHEVEALMATLMGRYAKLKAWRQKQVDDAQVLGEVWSRWTPPEPHSPRWVFRRSVAPIGDTRDTPEARKMVKHMKNIALNTPIQCIANCFSLASLTEAVRWTEEECPSARVVMTVHDSLLLECPKAEVDLVADAVKEIMLSWPSGVVKLKVDVEVGDDWGNMEKVG